MQATSKEASKRPGRRKNDNPPQGLAGTEKKKLTRHSSAEIGHSVLQALAPDEEDDEGDRASENGKNNGEGKSTNAPEVVPNTPAGRTRAGSRRRRGEDAGVKWLVKYEMSGLTVELKEGENVLGRDNDHRRAKLGVTDVRISRNHMILDLSKNKVHGVALGRNALRYVAPNGKSRKYTKGEEFEFHVDGHIEMSYFQKGSHIIRLIKQESGSRTPKRGVSNSQKLKVEELEGEEQAVDQSDNLSEAAQVNQDHKSPTVGNEEPIEVRSDYDEPYDKMKDPPEKNYRALEGGLKKSIGGIEEGAPPPSIGTLGRSTSSTWIQNTDNHLEKTNGDQEDTSQSGKGSPGSGSPRTRLWNKPLTVDPHFKASHLTWNGLDPFQQENSGSEEASSEAGGILSSSRSFSPTFETTNKQPARTAEEFPFHRQGSRSSIMSSDKHPSHISLSPRSLKRKRNSIDEGSSGGEWGDQQRAKDGESLDEGGRRSPRITESERSRRDSRTRPENDAAEFVLKPGLRRSDRFAKGKGDSDEGDADIDSASADMETPVIVAPNMDGSVKEDIVGGRGTPRVGSDYQVEIPSLLSNARPLNKITGEGKGSIGAWAKVFQTEPEPLSETADETEDTTDNWTEEEKLWFHKSMFEYLKDFHQMWRHTPVLQKNGKTPQDLIAYYYRRYKDTDDYRRWKVYVSEGTGQLPEGMVALDEGAKQTPAAYATLKEMIDAGLLVPGPDKLEIHHRGEVIRAALTADGLILFQGMEFDTLSNFSVYVKRLQTPGLKADDGWFSVHYEGRTLAEIRDEAATKRFPTASSVSGTGSGPTIVQGLGAAPGAQPRDSRTRRSSVMSATGQPTNQNGKSTPITASAGGSTSSSLPAGFAARARSNVNQKTSALSASSSGTPNVVRSPWKLTDPQQGAGSRRGPGRTRTVAQRQSGFFGLHFDSNSEDDDDADDTSSGIWPASSNGVPSPSNAGSSATPAPTVSSQGKKLVTLKQIVDSGLLAPGERLFRVRYRGEVFYGDLTADGNIIDCQNGKEYSIPSAWTIDIKRSLNPSVRTDSGWFSIQVLPRGGQTPSNSDDVGSASPKRNISGEDEDDEDLQNLYVYRKMLLAQSKERKEEAKRERYSIVSEVERMRQYLEESKSSGSRPGFRMERTNRSTADIAARQYVYANLLPSRSAKDEASEEEAVEDEDAASSDGNESTSLPPRGNANVGGGRGRKRKLQTPNRGATAAKKVQEEFGKKVTKRLQKFCICQVSSDDGQHDDDWFLQCSKGTGACNGWIHPKCFGLHIDQRSASELTEFVCPLCSGDGIDLKLFDGNRQIKDKATTYAPGTLIMSRIDFPRNNPIGWFPAKVVDVDFHHHPETPYRIVYAMDPNLSEWIDIGPNNPTRMLASDWSRFECYLDQDTYWRKRAQKAHKNLNAST